MGKQIKSENEEWLKMEYFFGVLEVKVLRS